MTLKEIKLRTKIYRTMTKGETQVLADVLSHVFVAIGQEGYNKVRDRYWKVKIREFEQI